MIRRVSVLLSLLALSIAARSVAQDKPAQSKVDAIVGEWWTQNNQGRVRIAKDRDGTFHGVTTCCVHENDPENPAQDIHNPNPKQRGRSTVGIVVFWKLKYDADDGEYVDGYVYNPRDGKTYRIEMKVIDAETLKIHGYLGISLFGQSQIWKRVHAKAAAAQ